MDNETTNRLLSVKEAATFLGIKPQTLYQHRLDIARVKIGDRVLFKVQDLNAYIDAHRIEVNQ